MTRELLRLDAFDQAALIRRGEATASELLEATLAHIQEVEPKVHALCTSDFEAARRKAASSPSGALGGVPFLVKDLAAYPGLRHAMGSRLFAGNVVIDATPYSTRLDAAGVIVLGKTAVSELGLLGSTETLLDGPTHNPWDPTRSAGGSSGGAAAAVASGMVALAHASDGGGSIRGPASMNGVFGFMPSAGRVVPTGPADMHGLLVDHCVSRSVRDSALLLSLTERTDGPLQPVGFVDGPHQRRLRIGMYTSTLMGQEPCASARRAVEHTAQLCRALGHEVIESPAPDVDGRGVSDAFFTVAGSFLAELDAMMQPMLGRPLGDADLEPFTLAVLAWYRGLPEGALARALEIRAREAERMRAFLARFDVTLCPTVPVEVFPLGTLAPGLPREVLMERTERLAGYTPIHNMAGVPAMSVPLSSDEQGLPLGSHFAAPRGADAVLLSLAYELEAASPWPGRAPAFV